MKDFTKHEIRWTDETTGRLWDYYSQTYPYNDLYFAKACGRDIILQSQKTIGKIRDKSVLDFGCGPGFMADHLSSLNSAPKNYTGIDFSEKSIKIVETKKLEFDTQSLFIRELPTGLPSESFDLCFLIEVIEHLEDNHLNQTLTEIKRLLKPGAHLIVTTPNSEDLRLEKVFCPDCGCLFHKMQHVRSWNMQSLSTFMQESGFAVTCVKTLTFSDSRFNIYNKLVNKIKNIIGRNCRSLFGIFTKMLQ